MSQIEPYLPTSPGDLITADLFNGVQVRTRREIRELIDAAVRAHQSVDHAKNADTLERKSAQELSDEIVERAMRALPSRTGYMTVYKRLQPDEPAIIRHGLKAYPLVDVYELERFPVVASADGKQWYEHVHWFLYHRTEMKIRKPEGAPADVPGLVTIEESRGPVFKHRFEDVLALHEVRYDNQSNLGDVVNELWKKLFSGPNDPFDETSFANSPWFDRCCGDRRTVESLRRGGEWDDLYLKVVPRKTINSLSPVWPLGVEVMHHDMDSVGLVRADFARLTREGLEQAFEAVGGERQASPIVAGPGFPEKIVEPVLKEAIREAPLEVRERADLPLRLARDWPVETLVRRLEQETARAVAARGRPEAGELFLMVLLKV